MLFLFVTIPFNSGMEKICKFLFLGTKLNQVSSSLKKIKLLLCWRVLMRTESADSDKWQ